MSGARTLGSTTSPLLATAEQRDRAQREQEQFLTEGGVTGRRPLSLRLDQDEDTTLANLRRLGADHTRFLRANHPVISSLWLALLGNADQCVSEYRARLRVPAASESLNSDDPSEAPVEDRSEDTGIVALGKAILAKALLGDTTAMNLITERLDGKVGLRKGDEDPDKLAQREAVQEGLAKVVDLLVKAKHGKPLDLDVEDISDITPSSAETEMQGAATDVPSS